MKTTLSIYGNDYEIEFKVRDKRNVNASKKAAIKLLEWFEVRLWESSCYGDNVGTEFNKEIIQNANSLYQFKINMKG